MNMCLEREPALQVRVDSDTTSTGTSSPEARPEFRGYLLSTFVFIAVLLGLTAGFNYLVDPYLLFGRPRLEGFNALKPAAIKQVKMAKAYQVCQAQYRTILLGNSRVDVGLNPTSRAFPTDYRPVYNLGQPGTGSAVALLYLEHVLDHYHPSHVLVGVDFLSYLEEPGRRRNDPDVPNVSPELRRLSSIHDSGPDLARTHQRVHDVLAADLSLSALADSLRTLAAQEDPLSANITDQGFNSAQAFHSLIRVEGQAALFQQKNDEYEEKLRRQHAPDFGSSSEIAAVAGILERCHKQEIKVKLFIHPYHADVLRIIERTGHWDEFESWKRYLASVCNRHQVELWDFSEYSTVTLEKVPEPGDRKTVMDGYWESGHYRAAVGDLLLTRMFGNPTVSGFGSRLSPN